MLTEFQRRKVDRSFRHFDVNSDGFIDVRDGGKLAQAYINGLGPTDPFVQLAVHERVEVYYKQLARGLDSDKDGRISPTEFREIFDREIVAPADGFHRYLRPLVDVVFTCCDMDGDGRIDRREFVSMQKLLGATEGAAAAAFRRLDTDGDGRISRQEFAAAAQDYYTGDDPQGLGAALFGEV